MTGTETPSQARAEPALTVSAPAKVNLTLRISSRRPDGYHELESLMVAVSLCDELALEKGPGAAWCLCCDRPEVPTDQRNLVWRAAQELARAASRQVGSGPGLEGLQVTLSKRIPSGAGLGGGSSDAAAALTAINELYRLGLGRPELRACAARLGSDVPFFLHGRGAIVRGRGEQIEPVSLRWPGTFLLICPPLHCATAQVYARWQPERSHDRRPINPFSGGAQPNAAELAERLFNDLEAPAFRTYPELAEWHRRVQAVCPLPLRLSGSGSALFCPLDTEDTAQELAATLKNRFGLAVFITQLLSDRNQRGAAT